ncbi:MAG: PD-(D/E)XK nuclease family transposase, partial [Bacteroidales bacterium]|nr:PD-(D/E)XK nuclease family transposase [Bacteroidales bacterium]
MGRKITDVVYLQTEVLGFSNKEKRIIFDLYCEDQIMNRMIVEMQRAEQEY